MTKQCCVCKGGVPTDLLTSFVEIDFACPYNRRGGEAQVHRGYCWTKLWEAYLANLRKQRAQAGFIA